MPQLINGAFEMVDNLTTDPDQSLDILSQSAGTFLAAAAVRLKGERVRKKILLDPVSLMCQQYGTKIHPFKLGFTQIFLRDPFIGAAGYIFNFKALSFRYLMYRVFTWPDVMFFLDHQLDSSFYLILAGHDPFCDQNKSCKILDELGIKYYLGPKLVHGFSWLVPSCGDKIVAWDRGVMS